MNVYYNAVDGAPERFSAVPKITAGGSGRISKKAVYVSNMDARSVYDAQDRTGQSYELTAKSRKLFAKIVTNDAKYGKNVSQIKYDSGYKAIRSTVVSKRHVDLGKVWSWKDEQERWLSFIRECF